MNTFAKFNKWMDAAAVAFSVVGVSILVKLIRHPDPIFALGCMAAFLMAGLLFWVRCLRPQQNRQVIMSDFMGYAQQAVPSGGFVTYVRWIEKPSREIDMGRRTARFSLDRVPAKDKMYFNLWVEIYFVIDLTTVDKATLRNLCHHREESAWNGMVGKIAGGTIREYWAEHESGFFLDPRNRRVLCRELTCLVAAALRRTGAVVAGSYGVSIRDSLPNPQVGDAMDRQKSTEVDGETMARLYETLLNATGGDPQIAAQLLSLYYLVQQNNGVVPMLEFPGRGAERPPEAPKLPGPGGMSRV